MNAGSVKTPAFPEPPAATGWGWKKLCLIILLAFATHLAFVSLLGTKAVVTPRAVRNVPMFQLANQADEFVRLTDPTLFALPDPEALAAAGSPVSPDLLNPAFRYTEPPAFLAAPAAATLGAAFKTFMQTNRVAAFTPSFKPEPQRLAPAVGIVTALPQSSTWHVVGDLAGRPIVTPITVPSLAVNDIIAPSRVQVLVEQDGHVASAVLLDSSEYDDTDHYTPADQQALDLARTLRFAPADRLMFGRIIFDWHTVPVANTNAP
jgi:hypothetical protein